jgi:hypothetical protein
MGFRTLICGLALLHANEPSGVRPRVLASIGSQRPERTESRWAGGLRKARPFERRIASPGIHPVLRGLFLVGRPLPKGF